MIYLSRNHLILFKLLKKVGNLSNQKMKKVIYQKKSVHICVLNLASLHQLYHPFCQGVFAFGVIVGFKAGA